MFQTLASIGILYHAHYWLPLSAANDMSKSGITGIGRRWRRHWTIQPSRRYIDDGLPRLRAGFHFDMSPEGRRRAISDFLFEVSFLGFHYLRVIRRRYSLSPDGHQ